ncbi:MAG: hypothetical protein ACYSWZ_05370 [Planctomycetota bacterium]|jgi:hypothetical protein
MKKSSSISQERNKANASQPLETKANQELLDTNRFLYIASIGCAILVAMFIALGISIHEFFGFPAGIFLILCIISAADTQKHKMRRTTFYTIMSFLFFCFGTLCVTLDEHVHSTFGFGIMLLYGAGGLACIMTFIFILSDGEIIKISGIGKLVCMILIMSLAMKYMVWRLNKVRHENFMRDYGTPAATVSHQNSPDNHQN